MTQSTQERPTLTQQITENWLAALGNVCWAQEQAEGIVRTMLDQGRTSREDGRRMAEKLVEAARKNQEEMQRFMQSAVQMSLATLRIPTIQQVDDLTRKVEDLTRKVETLSKKG